MNAARPSMARDSDKIHSEDSALRPSLDTTLNARRPSLRDLKRKRSLSISSSVQKWDSSFILRPHPTTVYDRPHAFSSLLLIPRVRLSLAHLDVGGPSAIAGHIFTGLVNAFEPHLSPVSSSADPMVLIAKFTPGGSLFAIEQVEPQVFALCKLGSWVTLGELKGQAVSIGATLKEVLRSSDDPPAADDSSERVAHDAFRTKDSGSISQERKKRKLERAQSIQVLMQKKPSTPTLPTPPPSDGVERDTVVQAIDRGILDEPADSLSNPQIPVDSLLEFLLSHYFDSLYLNSMSLAYFAKGPLSRARAAVSAVDPDSAIEDKLIEMLRSLIIPLTTLEKKYNTTLKDSTSLFLNDEFSDDDEHLAGDPKKSPAAPKLAVDGQVRKKNAFKVRRDGTYPSELAFVKYWWKKRDYDSGSSRSGESREQRKARKLFQLRKRETKLQIILLLEIMSLQASKAPVSISDKPEEGGQGPTSVQKRTKELDLGLLLDLHVDKLAIWQSLGPDGSFAGLVDSPEKQSKPAAPKELKANMESIDGLQSFCAEVVIPFFSARLPKKIPAIVKSLGGPKIPALKPKRESQFSLQEQGQPRQRQRKPMQRTFTDGKMKETGSQRRPKPPGLTRSATVPILPVSREDSVDDVMSTSQKPNRGSKIQHAAKFTRREVDLSASSGSDPKLKRSSASANDLKEAIFALRKPNRKLMAEELADGRESRLSGRSGLSKGSSKSTSQRLSEQDVQVLSTPRGPRKSDVIHPNSNLAETPPRHRQIMDRAFGLRDFEGISLVPASSPPVGIEDTPRHLPLVQCVETPRFKGSEGEHQPSLPPFLRTLSSQSVHSQLAPVTPCRRTTRLLCQSTPDQALETIDSAMYNAKPPDSAHTDTKESGETKSNVNTGGFSRETMIEGGVVDGHDSIYDALGWNDMDDI